MKTKVCIGLASALGGIAPNLLQIATDLTEGKTAVQALYDETYLIGLIIFAVVGAAMGLIWNETDLKKAFYLGIGLPAMLHLSIDNVNKTPEQTASRQQGIGYFSAIMPQAFAQSFNVPGRRLIIRPEGTVPSFNIVFFEQSDKECGRIAKDDVEIPPTATCVEVHLGNSVSTRVRLPSLAGQTFTYVLRASKNEWRGFKRALGVRSPAEYSVSLERE